MRLTRTVSILIVAMCALLGVTAATAQEKPLRFPDVSGDKVVFSYAGDLWTAPTSGGTARRLTAHPGVEFFAKYSPDGKWIAFTGQYDGDEQVYVIPAEGGEPKQLTYYPARGPMAPRHGYDNQVYGWTPDGKSVLFRSFRDAGGASETKLYTVPVTGGLPVALPMPDSGAGTLSPDGKKVFYSPLFRDFRTWKRYEGGWAQDLYTFDLATSGVEQITNHVRTDRDPMWIGEKLYWVSDRDGKLNIHSYDLKSKQTTQLTRSKTFDVRWASADESAGGGQIVYEFGGELQVFNTRNGQDRKVAIHVPDDGLHRRPARVSAANQIEDFELSPKGQRALFVARGDVFTAPIEKGATRNLTNTSNAHDKWARWSPDGRKIAFVSDMTGEEEIYLIDQDGSGKPEQLTTGGQAMRFAPEWAPDGKRLAFSDKDGKLYVLTLADKKLAQIADEKRGQIRDYTWSGDGGHLAFSLSNPSGTSSLQIWSVNDAQVRQVTDPIFHAFNPVWDPEGNYLWFLSVREFAPQLGGVELNFLMTRPAGIFGLALRKDVKHVFGPESDEVTIEAEKPAAEKEAKPAEAPKKEKEYIKIDFDGLAGRVARVPIAADNYGGLSVTKTHLVYVRGGDFFLGRQSGAEPALLIYSLKDRKETQVATGTGGYAISADGTKALVRQGPQFRLYNIPPGPPDSVKTVATTGLMVDRVPGEEWKQIFNEVWRRYRDFFYVVNMHGYDWKALREQYLPQVEKVAHRSDLNYIIGEMISELNVGHAYVEGGDFQIPPRPRVALPGARLALDAASGKYKVAKIFRGQNEEERYRSPLSEIGVDVKEGDYVLAIDGEELKATEDPYRLLKNKADRTVQLTVNSKPAMEGARKVSYRPIASEADLIYLDWVTSNREKVAKMTGGRVGYIHVPDMGAPGMYEFIKYYYPQIKMEGMVVDVRSNGGGFISQTLIERLRRTLLATGFSRNSEDTDTYPDALFYGHLVCLLNETSASDGDIFPAMFRKAGLGPLVGKRSWGGVVGITNRGQLIDGGVIFVPEFGNANDKGQWDIEGHGVDPDIVVENDPKSVIGGRDPQLERGVEEVMKKMQASPKKLPGKPADPVKIK